MGSATENCNIVTEFEQAFGEILSTLTQENFFFDKNAENLKRDLENKVLRFTDLARQLETFFLQKRFLISSSRPEMILKEDSNEIRQEIAKKDELLKYYYDRLIIWQSMLQDMQSPPAQQQTAQGVRSQAGPTLQPNVAGNRPASFVPGNNYRMNSPHQQISGPLAYLEKTANNVGGASGPPR